MDAQRVAACAALGLVALLASPAPALAEGETVYVVESAPVDNLRSSVDAVSSGLTSLSSTVTTYHDLLAADIDSQADTLGAVADAQSAQGATLTAVSDGVTANGETLATVNDKLDSQAETLDTVAAAVSAEPDAPSKMDFADVMALVPDAAPAQLIEYLSYPFLWGMASGIVAYIISLTIGAVYRLMGLR